MPHLSPLNWIIAPFIFWSIMLIIMSNLWWSQSINFPELTYSLDNKMSNKWYW